MDLEVAFYCIPLDEDSQEIFAFEWEDLEGYKIQMCWCVLPQGFKNSSTLFRTALATVFCPWWPPKTSLCTLLQYVDDLLLCTLNKEGCV